MLFSKSITRNESVCHTRSYLWGVFELSWFERERERERERW